MTGREENRRAVIYARYSSKAHREVRAWKRGVEAIIEAGLRLIEVRKKYEDDPGQWSRLMLQ